MPELQLAVRIALSHPPGMAAGPAAPAATVAFDCACPARRRLQPSTFSAMLRDAQQALADTAPPELRGDAVFPQLLEALRDGMGARMQWRAAAGAEGVTHRAAARDPRMCVEAGRCVLSAAAAATTIPLVRVRLCTGEGIAEAMLAMKTVQHFLCKDGAAREVPFAAVARLCGRCVSMDGQHAHRALLKNIFPAQWQAMVRGSRASRETCGRVFTTPLPVSGVSLVSVCT